MINMNVRPVMEEDIPDIIKIHVSSFKDFFLTSLGDEFLKIYYKAYIKNPNALLLCIEDDSRNVVGFAAAAIDSVGFNKKLILYSPLAFLFISIKLILSRPRALLRLLKNFTKRNETIEDDGDYAELFSIAVSPNQQGKGIGKLLLASSEDYVRSKNIAKMSLTTDYYNNDKTIRFYQAMGYHELYEFIAYPNRKMYRFIKEL